MSPFSFSPMWFHTSTPQVHFELQVQMNAKISTKKTVKTTAHCGRTKPNRVSGGFKQKIEINLFGDCFLRHAVKTEYWLLLP